MKKLICLVLFVALSNVLFGQKLQTPGGVIESTDPTSAKKDIVLKTNNNAVNQGLSFQNSGGNYTYRMYDHNKALLHMHLNILQNSFESHTFWISNIWSAYVV